MLTVYSTSWCPHCRKTVDFLVKNHLDFVYKDIERQPKEDVSRVDAANGGSWIVPTLEFKGQWRPGKKFDADEIKSVLMKWGLLS